MKLEVEACSELHQETGTGLLSPASESPGLDNATMVLEWKMEMATLDNVDLTAAAQCVPG